MDSRTLDVTVDQLTVLVDVVEAGGFTAAARAHRRTQAAVSYHIARLEEQLGLTLFDRGGRRPVLTEAGTAIVARARTVLGALDRLVVTAQELRAGVEPALSVCVDVLYPPDAIAHMLQAFEHKFPNVPLSVTTGVWRQPMEALREGRAQLAVATPMAGGGLRMHPTARVAFVPVVSATHPLATVEGPVSLDQLKAHRRLVLMSGAGLPEEEAQRRGEVWRLDNAAIRRGLLLQGVGWARLVRWQVADDLAAGRLVALEIDGNVGPEHVELAVAVDPTRAIGPATRWLYELLADGAR